MCALYRKYAPRTFDDVKGQDVAIKVLKTLMNSNKTHAGIIFSGIHGIGKTLLARIFAKALNCLSEDKKKKPCLICDNCKKIDENCSDFLEVDGATYTGIENIRKIIDDTKYLPTFLKCKVYVIDEVHRLSRQAFDSLLKTIEEPPEFVQFIFATTDRKNIPDTIISRCLSLPLSRLSRSIIKDHLEYICKKENFVLSEKILDVIATESGGSMRDSLSTLELIMLSNIQNDESILEYLRVFSRENIFSIITFILKGTPNLAIDLWKKMRDKGYDEKNFFHKMSEIISNIFLVKDNNKNIEEFEKYNELITNYDISFNILIGWWEIIINSTEALYAGCSFTVEMTIMSMSLIEDSTDLLKEVKKIFKGVKTL